MLFSTRRWRFLLNLIDHLGRTSHFIAAVANDDELAEQQAAGTAPAGAPTVPMTEFGSVEERLNALIDRIGELISLEVGKATQKKPKPVKPYPRPVTAAQRLAQRRKRDGHARTSLRLLGDRSMYHRR